jgi:hypothetical protein
MDDLVGAVTRCRCGCIRNFGFWVGARSWDDAPVADVVAAFEQYAGKPPTSVDGPLPEFFSA